MYYDPFLAAAAAANADPNYRIQVGIIIRLFPKYGKSKWLFDILSEIVVQ